MLWKKNGVLVSKNGVLLDCDSCPCQPCNFSIWLAGTDWYRPSLDDTHHHFKITLNNATIVDGTLGGSVGGEVDKGGDVSGGGRSITITMTNNGSAREYDTYSWNVGGQCEMDNMNDTKLDYDIAHSWSGAATSSTIDDQGDSLDCPNNDTEEFE